MLITEVPYFAYGERGRERERERERSWLELVTCLQNKTISEGRILCLTIFCLVCSQRSRNDRKRKIDLLTLLAHITTVTETKAKISA